MKWQKGRGKLGVFKPLLGAWRCEADSQMGPVVCLRVFEPALNGRYIQLDCLWQFTHGKNYSERCLFGINHEKTLSFWSFTSDGKQSSGWQDRADDVHPDALCFSADMPGGRARQIYWPGEDGDLRWAVESRNKKGFNRFVDHSYYPHVSD